MTLETIKLADLEPPAANPRQSFDEASLEGLAESIKADGLLQNLVAVRTRGGRYRIVSGERRFRALHLLLERGDIEGGYPVPVEVRHKLSKRDVDRLATVENVQRENLHPLDEAAAFAKLLRRNVTLDDIAAETGMAVRTIRQRLALLELAEDVQEAFRAGQLSLGQAQAFTCAPADRQARVLEQIDGSDYTASEIRELCVDDRPSVADAIFDVSTYTGTLTTDLFAEDETTYFDDEDAFFTLQAEAVRELTARHLAEGAAFAEVTDGYGPPRWAYREAKDGENAGVVINFAPSGRVEVLEGVVPQSAASTDAAASGASAAGPKPFYSGPLCREIAYRKSLAVQRTLLDHPRTAKELACALMLSGSLKPHPSLKHSSDPGIADYAAIDDRVALCIRALEATGLELEVDGDRPSWFGLIHTFRTPGDLYAAVTHLPDADLDNLFVLLVSLQIGQEFCDSLDMDPDSLMNRVALDLGIDMLEHWRPDAVFLNRRSRAQIEGILREVGLSPTSFTGVTKAKLVEDLAARFAAAQEVDEPDAAKQRLNDWLPGAMLFPAEEPRAETESEVDAEAA